MASPAEARGSAGRQAPPGGAATSTGEAPAEGRTGAPGQGGGAPEDGTAPLSGATATTAGTETDGPDGTDPGGTGPGPEATRGLSDRALAAIAAAVTLPILWMGYGTDIDIGDVRHTGSLIRNADYHPSRTPGVPVFESVVAVLDPLGHVAINLACTVAAIATVLGITRLVRIWGRPNGDLVALAFLAFPITIVAATSTTDFIWAMAFFVWGAVMHLRDRSLPAAALFALAVGSRSSTALVIVAFLAADGWAADKRGRCLRTLAAVIPLALLLYVPSWMAFDRTLGFLDHSNGWRGLKNNFGRFAYKNYVVAGAALVLVALATVPALLRSLRGWGRYLMVRTAVFGFVASELLFLQLPWKPAHLLPAVLMFVLWVGASDRNRRPFLWVLIAAIALNGLVAFRPLTPDAPDRSTTADFDPVVMYGWLLNDVRCRGRYMDVEPTFDNGAWFCSLEPMRGPTVITPGVAPPDDVLSAGQRASWAASTAAEPTSAMTSSVWASPGNSTS